MSIPNAPMVFMGAPDITNVFVPLDPLLTLLQLVNTQQVLVRLTTSACNYATKLHSRGVSYDFCIELIVSNIQKSTGL